VKWALDGVEAVIDKDLSAELLAGRLGAGFLLLLTDVHVLERDSGTRQAARIDEATPGELTRMGFESGSMAPDHEAACRFVEKIGGIAAIGALGDSPALLRGETGDSGRLPRRD
jgi:carbamate kinase